MRSKILLPSGDPDIVDQRHDRRQSRDQIGARRPCQRLFRLRGLFALGGLYADLEDALKKSIDVVTTGSLKYNKDEAFLENLRKDRVLLYELS